MVLFILETLFADGGNILYAIDTLVLLIIQLLHIITFDVQLITALSAYMEIISYTENKFDIKEKKIINRITKPNQEVQHWLGGIRFNIFTINIY